MLISDHIFGTYIRKGIRELFNLKKLLAIKLFRIIKGNCLNENLKIQ